MVKSLKLTPIYKNSLILSQDQKDILIGLLLGDLNITFRSYSGKKGTKFPCLQFCQSDFHKPYLNHLFLIFQAFINSPMRLRVSTNTWYFQTLTHKDFDYYAKLFYNNQIKIIPDNLYDLLTPKGLAYWYMDDGSMKSKQSKGVLLNTHGFTLS
jgi:hypothetical protein